MMMTIYFISASLISAIIFLLNNKKVNQILGPVFLVLQLGIGGYALLHREGQDSVYFTFDSLGILLTLVLSILSITTFYHSHLYLKRHKGLQKHESIYYAALILLIEAMTGAYFANNIGVLWALFEVTTLCVTALIYHERSSIAIEAAWKYIFICSIGISFAFMGILFLSTVAYEGGLTDLNLPDLVATAKGMDITWLKIAFILIFTGFSAKWGLFPLHSVCVDAHTGAPPPISAFISTTLMNVGFLGVFRVYSIIAQTDALPWASHVLMICGTISIGLSAMQLLRVKHFKRMFAFSSLEQMGIVAIAMAAGGIGYYAAVLHIVLHSFAKAGLFYHIGQVDHVYHSYWIKDTSGYMKINPLGAIVMLLILIMITAMPPSGLFISELMAFRALFASQHYLVAVLALGFISVIIFVFGRNFCKILYTEDASKQTAKPVIINKAETISQFVLIGIIIYLAFSPPLFFTELIDSSVSVMKCQNCNDGITNLLDSKYFP